MLSKTAQILIGAELFLFLGGAAAITVWRDAHERAGLRSRQEIESQKQTPTFKEAATAEPKTKVPAPPDLNRPIVVTVTFPPDVEKKTLAHLTELTERLKKNPELGDWLELGTYRKGIGDSDAAEEIWSYVAAAYPSDAISLSNLANLYIYDRHDLKKGESYLLAAIGKAPFQVSYYETAYELYHFVLKDDEKGKAVIQKGLLANPESAEAFKAILARF